MRYVHPMEDVLISNIIRYDTDFPFSPINQRNNNYLSLDSKISIHPKKILLPLRHVYEGFVIGNLWCIWPNGKTDSLILV